MRHVTLNDNPRVYIDLVMLTINTRTPDAISASPHDLNHFCCMPWLLAKVSLRSRSFEQLRISPMSSTTRRRESVGVRHAAPTVTAVSAELPMIFLVPRFPSVPSGTVWCTFLLSCVWVNEHVKSHLYGDIARHFCHDPNDVAV